MQLVLNIKILIGKSFLERIIVIGQVFVLVSLVRIVKISI